MNIDTFKEGDTSLLYEGVRAATHKIAARLTMNVIPAARLVAKDNHPLCDVFLESNHGRTSKKLLSTEVCFDGESEVIIATILSQSFLNAHPEAEHLIKEELRVCEFVYNLPTTQFCAPLNSSD
ncbi:MAG TPA: hypothetical protein VMR73_01655 [Candidatus Paceibacterota bacterium]|nr:hypothetical protein [Candidatus Paceibacterota bacterium]